MPVFSRFDPTKAGNVNAQAHPNVYVYPWISTQKAVRTNPTPASSVGTTGSPIVANGKQNFGTRIQRIQPNEKNSFFSKRGYSMGASSPNRDKCSCGGGCTGSTEGFGKKDGTT